MCFVPAARVAIILTFVELFLASVAPAATCQDAFKSPAGVGVTAGLRKLMPQSNEVASFEKSGMMMAITHSPSARTEHLKASSQLLTAAGVPHRVVSLYPTSGIVILSDQVPLNSRFGAFLSQFPRSHQSFLVYTPDESMFMPAGRLSKEVDYLPADHFLHLSPYDIQQLAIGNYETIEQRVLRKTQIAHQTYQNLWAPNVVKGSSALLDVHRQEEIYIEETPFELQEQIKRLGQAFNLKNFHEIGFLALEFTDGTFEFSTFVTSRLEYGIAQRDLDETMDQLMSRLVEIQKTDTKTVKMVHNFHLHPDRGLPPLSLSREDIQYAKQEVRSLQERGLNVPFSITALPIALSYLGRVRIPLEELYGFGNSYSPIEIPVSRPLMVRAVLGPGF